MAFEIVQRQTLRHNPLNEVTASVERVADAGGATRIRKELRRPSPESGGSRWAASLDPRHWNYWRREADAYLHQPLRHSLRQAGLDLPYADVDENDHDITLWLEDVAGRAGGDFTLPDHIALAEALGRWQARGPMLTAWSSQGFLRHYSSVRMASWHTVDDDRAWARPLIRDTWPAGLRQGWERLVAHRMSLLDVMERLPRTRSHLDFWVSNQIRRPSGEIVLLDWAFCGDGALGEDLGNHVPDAVFDLFWPAERLPELDRACFEAYLSGLRQAGWQGDEKQVRLGVVASCVKYTWLLPLMLEQAGHAEHRAYHQVADSRHLYRQRGLALSYLVGWLDEALELVASSKGP